MTDVGFIVAAYGVILGGMAVYAITLRRRLASLRDASLRIRGDAAAADAAELPDEAP
jgi:hypothetical protein